MKLNDSLYGFTVISETRIDEAELVRQAVLIRGTHQSLIEKLKKILLPRTKDFLPNTTLRKVCPEKETVWTTA